MLKIVLLAYSRGLITSRKFERACEQNVLFMPVSGDERPCYTISPGSCASSGRRSVRCSPRCS